MGCLLRRRPRGDGRPALPRHGADDALHPRAEGKTAKNRLHLDLQPSDRTRDAAVEQALSLGATVVGDFREPDGSGWVTMADPEGNEFCIERSADERRRPDGVLAYRIGT